MAFDFDKAAARCDQITLTTLGKSCLYTPKGATSPLGSPVTCIFDINIAALTDDGFSNRYGTAADHHLVELNNVQILKAQIPNAKEGDCLQQPDGSLKYLSMLVLDEDHVQVWAVSHG